MTGENDLEPKSTDGIQSLQDGEDKNKNANKSRSSFQPTNFAFLPDGGFLLADGYGSYHIHRFDKDGKYVSTFGGEGKGRAKEI